VLALNFISFDTSWHAESHSRKMTDEKLEEPFRRYLSQPTIKMIKWKYRRRQQQLQQNLQQKPEGFLNT